MDLWTMPSSHVTLVARVSHAFYTHLSSKYEIDSNLLHARIHWISVQQDRQEIWQRLQAAVPTLEANVPVGWFADSAAAQEYGSVALDIDEEFADVLKHIVDVQPEDEEEEAPDKEPTHHPYTEEHQTTEFDIDYQEYQWDHQDRNMAADAVRNPWHEEFGSPTSVGFATRSSQHRPKLAHLVQAQPSNTRHHRLGNQLPQSPYAGIMIASTKPNPLRRLPSPVVDVIEDGSPLSALSAPSRTYPLRRDPYDAYSYYNDQRSRPRTWTAQGHLDLSHYL